MENLCSWKNQKRKKVLGKKTRRKEERKGTSLSGKEKKSFVKATRASGAFTLASRFRTKKSLSIQNLTYMMLKTRLPFLYASTSLDTKTSTIASNRNFKAVCRFVVLLLSSFCGFSIFAAGFSFAFGNFVRYCNVLLNAPLSDRDKKKKVFEMGYFSREILIRRHWRQEVLPSYWFAVSGGEIISWRGASCLRTFMS